MFFSFQTCIIFLLEKAKQLSEIHVLLEMNNKLQWLEIIVWLNVICADHLNKQLYVNNYITFYQCQRLAKTVSICESPLSHPNPESSCALVTKKQRNLLMPSCNPLQNCCLFKLATSFPNAANRNGCGLIFNYNLHFLIFLYRINLGIQLILQHVEVVDFKWWILFSYLFFLLVTIGHFNNL